MNFSYLVRRIADMDYKNMFHTVGKIHERTGKNRVVLFVDMVWCGFRYLAGYADYDLFQFYRLNAAQRATYLTRGKNNQAVRCFNNPDYTYLFEDKAQFNQKFSSFIHRESIDLKKSSVNEFADFLERHPTVIAKPADGICGRGVLKTSLSDFLDAQDMYRFLTESGRTLIEQVIEQQEDISAIYPNSVNTLRIVTILKEDGIADVVFSSIRIGNHGSFVDNLNSGGMSALIDSTTGAIIKAGEDKDLITYDTHPMTGKPIVGFTVPMFDKAIELCKQAATVVPQIRYVAWDVAMTNDGPELIEGNTFPGHDIMQLSSQRENGIGILPVFQKYMAFSH